MSKKKEMYAPLTRWQYFTKTLYHDPSKTQEFEYDGVIYLKSQELQDIEERNARVNWLLLLVLCAMFLTAIKWQNIVVIALGMVVIVAGELFRMSRLPKDIKAHLTDSGGGSCDGDEDHRPDPDGAAGEVRRAPAERPGAPAAGPGDL